MKKTRKRETWKRKTGKERRKKRPQKRRSHGTLASAQYWQHRKEPYKSEEKRKGTKERVFKPRAVPQKGSATTTWWRRTAGKSKKAKGNGASTKEKVQRRQKCAGSGDGRVRGIRWGRVKRAGTQL